jgi:hypothetical protein
VEFMSDVPSNNGAPASSAPAPEAPQQQQQTQQQQYQKPQSPVSTRKTYNIKVDGEEIPVDFDPSNEEEVRKHLQMSRASQKRMQQFSEYEKGVRGLFDQLQKDPLKVLGDPRLGISQETRKKLAEQLINNEIEEMQKSPEVREKERLQREYEELKKQHEQEKTGREKAEFARLQEQAMVQLDVDISAAIEGANLPKTARTVKYMAEALMLCLQNGLDLNAKDVLPYVQSQILGDFREIIGSLPDEGLEEWLGKDQINRIRKRTLQKLKTAATANTQVKSTAQGSSRDAAVKADQKKVPMKDFFKNLGK